MPKRTPKLRGDSKFLLLKPAAQEELERLARNNAPMATLQNFCEEHGVEWSIGRLSVFAARTRGKYERMQAGLSVRSELINVFREKLKAGNVSIEEAMLDELVQDYSDMLDSQADPNNPLSNALRDGVFDRILKKLTAQTKGAIAKKKLAIDQERLALDTNRFQFDAAKACLAKLRELRTIAANKSLNDSAKLDAVRRQLFGQLPAEVAA